MFLWFGDASIAPAATTSLVTLPTSKVAISHCTAEDQSIHMHLIYDYEQTEMILYLHKIELWTSIHSRGNDAQAPTAAVVTLLVSKASFLLFNKISEYSYVSDFFYFYLFNVSFGPKQLILFKS